MSITLTGDNNYSGVYSNVDVLGGANHGGGTFEDISAFSALDPNGIEFFMFGNLNYRSDVIFSGDHSTGTYAATTTGGAGDTLVFDFTLNAGGSSGTFNFLTSGFELGALSADTDGDADYQSPADVNGWNSQYAAWQTSLGAGVTYSDPTTIETGVHGGRTLTDPDANLTLNIMASGSTSPSLTSDFAGQKVLLGFAVGSDFLNLNGHSAITDDVFNQYFQVTASSHQSANHNTVNDTVVSLNDGSWSVDLYGVNVAALTTGYNIAHGTTLSVNDYFFDFIVAH